MDTVQLRQAHDRFLEAATRVAEAGGADLAPPTGEWNFEQILAHVALVDAASLTAVASVAAGVNTVFDNRVALDDWTIDHVITCAGSSDALAARVRSLGQTLCEVAENVLSATELETLVPSLLLSNDRLVVNEPATVEQLISGLAENELPGHTEQILDLLP